IVASLAGEETVSLLAAGRFFHWIKLCTYVLNLGKIFLPQRRKDAKGYLVKGVVAAFVWTPSCRYHVAKLRGNIAVWRDAR
ncbi:MAG: hypothetical protein OQK96_06400, partial [Gammaproteobacteria bacterium]|nr:hypothetical protein [Gammaproteobacteria bacterium]